MNRPNQLMIQWIFVFAMRRRCCLPPGCPGFLRHLLDYPLLLYYNLLAAPPPPYHPV